jgi:4'-phosphopantetheinyl transferase
VETRRILASLLGVSVDAIELEYGPKGKPVLLTDPALYFSVSHAQTVSMVAVTRAAPVGVDVEVVRAVPMAEAILRRFLTAEDVGEILTDDNRDFRFVRAWTRAEATVKVRGASVWEAATPDPLVTVRDVGAPEGYAASVAVAASEWYVTQTDWDGR